MTLSELEKRAHEAIDELSETAATDEFEGWQTELKAAHSAITALAEAGRTGGHVLRWREKVREAIIMLSQNPGSIAFTEKTISLLEDALRNKP